MPARVLVLLLLSCTLLPTGEPAAQVTSSFDVDAEGWLILGDNDAMWLASGGNPGGCYDVADLATGQLNLASAPAKFLGDWSSMGGSDSLAFDVYFQNTSGGALLTPSWMFEISGPGGSARGIVPGFAPPQNVWSRVATSLDSTDWAIQSGTWSAIVSHVNSLKLQVEYVNGDEIVRIDNVSLSVSPAPVFAPCVVSRFDGAGLEDWSYDGTNSVTLVADDGNIGGFLRVGDLSGQNSYLFAPARFLGDWSSLDDSGYITIDLRILSSSGTNQGSSEFIRLSGPGGVARAALAPEELPTSERIWKTIRIPLKESAWIVDSGTWSGLLAQVSGCRVDAEFFDGTEVVGIDNFARQMDGCPDVHPSITIHAPDVSLCAVHNFLDAGALAFNPADGRLYVAAREPSGSAGGGIYSLLGTTTPGVLLHSYSNPAGLLFDEDGDGYVSEDFAGVVYRFVGADSSLLWVSGFHSGDDDPYGMTFAPAGFNGANVSAGDILVVDRGNSGADEIWAFSPDSPENERLVKPDPGNVDWFDLTADDQGRVWVVDALAANSLFQLHPDGSFTTLPLSLALPGMSSIVYDPVDQMLYVATVGPSALYRVDPSDGTATLVADGFVGLGRAGLEIEPTQRLLWASDTDAERVYAFCLSGWTAVQPDPGVRRLAALRAMPNPFNAGTRIQFQLSAAADAELAIYDVSGRRVKLLANRSFEAGTHAILWDGSMDRGDRAAAGIYFARLRIAQGESVTRVALVR